jgi:multidrug efflux pump subunit AcrB
VSGFNLSDWALRHKSFVWYLMAVSMALGAASYMQLGREEDPAFTIKTMVIQAVWPGASTQDTIQQVTDRIEKKLQEVEGLDYTKSYTIPGQATIFVNLKDTTKAKDVPWRWYEVRKKVGDIRGDFPAGVQGPFFNDEFGDVYGNIYAFTADGLSYRQLRDYVEEVRTRVLSVPSTGKVDLIGAQREVIYLDFTTRQLAALGLSLQQVVASLQTQNSVVPSGVIQAGPERISVRTGGQFVSQESLRAVNLRVNDRFYRLSDFAVISRGYEDPPQPLFRFNGQPAIGLGIAMAKNGNLLEFGEALKTRMTEATADLPVGVGVHLVSDQPVVVEHAVAGFTEALVEAVLIVLVVSFISLGWRAGLVVACSIPLVLAMVFVFMEYTNTSMQRISLGALIIALGLLVDDAMITVEMMVKKLEEGETLEKAATFAYTSTAFPMLTGTLVTVAGFFPIGLNNSAAGEYCFTLFTVIAAALLISWIVAVLFAPLLGVTMLPARMKKHDEKPGRLTAWFHGFLLSSMRHRWATIGASIALLIASVVAMGYVQQQFFPPSDRPEVLVDLTLPQNSSIAETHTQMDRLEQVLKGDADVDRWSSYVGQGAIRFYLPLDQQLGNPFFGQIIVVTKGLEARHRVQAKLEKALREDFVGIDGLVHPLEVGPPVGRPVQYRVSGPDVERVRQLSHELAGIVGQNTNIGALTYDWNEPGKVVRLDVSQDKARQLGLSSEDLATAMNAVVTGAPITQVRDSIYLVNIVGRAEERERTSIDTLRNLQVPVSGSAKNGQTVPISAFATFRYELEQPLVWRRDRLPTITLKAEILGGAQPINVVTALQPSIDAFIHKLPSGYKVANGGTIEESAKSSGPIAAVVPLMLFTMATLLMIQLHSVQKLFLVVSVAPFALIGVVAALLPSGTPMGFVAILGILALIGIIIRNSVILVTQIDEFLAEGRAPWDAVVEATMHRVRPILLTAAAASLGMIPIAREIFWGAMAYAMIGGIIAATALTLVFLPALYVAWYRIREPEARTAVDA